MNARYQIPIGARLRLTTSSGDVTVIAEERTDVEAPDNAHVVTTRDEHGPILEVTSHRSGSRDLDLRCPAGTSISIGTSSGDVRLHGDFGPASVTTTSGDVSVDRAAALDARSVSGDLEVDSCHGHCRLNTKSGDIEAETTGPADVDTVSGDIDLGTGGTAPVKVRTISGQITVKVPEGRLPQTRLRSHSGEIECECPQGTDFLLDVTSVSGGIEVEPS